MTREIAHVGVTVADLERAVRFYTEGLGLEVAIRQTSAAVYLRDPDGYTIELFQPPTGLGHPSFSTGA